MDAEARDAARGGHFLGCMPLVAYSTGAWCLLFLYRVAHIQLVRPPTDTHRAASIVGTVSSRRYSYNDVTCTYGCQKTECLFWLLLTYLGAQEEPERATQIFHEWKQKWAG
jgi:hypothetical protein